MSWKTACVAAALSLAGLPAGALAAQIDVIGTLDVDGWSRTEIMLAGKIEPGDRRKIEKLLHDDENAIVLLNSVGGDYREGLALAHLFRDRLVSTVVPSGARCLSACAIAFLGGAAAGEEGGTANSRSMALDAELGFHAPYLRTSGQLLTEEAVLNAYDHAIRTVTDFVRSAAAFDISADVAADMMTPQRDELFYIRKVDDIQRIGLEVQDIAPARKLTMQMARNICANGLATGEMTFGEAYETMQTLLKDLKWPAKPVIPLKTGYFGPVSKGWRIVLPVFEGGEGIGHYTCIVDTVTIDGTLYAGNRGYIFTDDGQDIMKAAKGFDPGPEDYGEPEFASAFHIGAVDPLATSDGDSSLRFEIVRPDTPLKDVAKTIRALEADAPVIAEASGAGK